MSHVVATPALELEKARHNSSLGAVSRGFSSRFVLPKTFKNNFRTTRYTNLYQL
jgi:hypothetical protein